MQFNLEPTFAASVPHMAPFWAVRSEPQVIVLAGQHGFVKVPGDDIRLGAKFFNVNGVLVHSDDLATYKAPVLATVARIAKPVTSYKALAKGNKRKGRK
jgi:hypothetical protein